jgi:hypothetical protein
MIEKTTDYSMFKKHESNRALVRDNLDKIEKSILIKNLLEYRPILIDDEYYVIDGQHRLEVAKKLKLPIFYQIQKKSTVTDMFLLNANQRRWNPEDYLNFYCAEGKQDYIKFRDFISRHQIKLRQGLKLLSKFALKSTSRLGEVFNSGTWKFADDDRIIQAEEVLMKAQSVIDYVTTKMSGHNYFLNAQKFLIAMIDFFVLYPVDYDEFMKKLPFKLDTIHACSQTKQYLQIFVNIYNFRNKNPIRVDDYFVTEEVSKETDQVRQLAFNH